MIPIRMIDSVDSKKDKVGQTFQASIDEAIALNGETVIPRNADVLVKLSSLKQAGAVTGTTELQLRLERITIGGKPYDIVSNPLVERSKSQTTQTAKTGGIGAGIGAAIGAIAGGGKGAGIGAAIGGGAGVAAAAASNVDQVKIATESRLTFRLEQPLEVTVTSNSTTRR